MSKNNAWDWEEIGKELMSCEHCTGLVLFTWGRLSVVRCEWGCGHTMIEWTKCNGVTITIAEF